MEETPDAYQAGYDQAQWEATNLLRSETIAENNRVREEHASAVLASVEGLAALRHTTDMSVMSLRAIIRMIVNTKPIEKEIPQ